MANIYNGEISSGIILDSNDSLHVTSGGTATSTTVNYLGHLYVYDGGTATDTTVNFDGFLHVYSGGTATSTTVNNGYLYVYSGGTATSTTVNSGGRLYVSSGGTATSTTVNEEGNLYVDDGGTATSTTVNEWGYLYVSSGGTATDTTVDYEGTLYVYSGGTATNVVWTPFVGQIIVLDGAYVTYTSQHSGVYFGSDNQLLSHTNVMEGKVLEYHSMYVMSGGTATSTTVNSWGDLYVYDGGTATSTTVNFNGSLHVYSGGTTTDTTVNYFGHLYVYDGGTATSTTVNSGGDLRVSSDGTATEVRENGGYVYVADGANVTFVPNTISGLELSDTSATLHSGTTATSTTVNSSGYLYVSSGGTATSTTVNSGGDLRVSSGGTATATTVNSGGDLRVSSDGTATSTTVNEWGALYVSSGGTATSTTVNSGGYLYVYDGGTATSTTVNGYFDWGYYCDGRLYVSSGGTATSTTVNSGGSLWVSSGGSAVRTTVNSDGSLVVFSGGTVASATVNNGGALTVDSGGKALAIKENGGYVSVGSGTVVSFIPTALSGMILTDQATLHSGTTASDTTVSGGMLFVYDGGVAGNTTFAEGMLYLYQGALHKGTLTFESNYPGITTVMGYGGTVDFTVSERKTTDDYLINNLSYSGNLNFTITVSENQEQGTYKLAQKATYLTAFIMLENGDNCGTISVNQTLKYNETIYSLDLSAAGDLTLTISKEEQSGVLLTSSGSVVSSGTVLSNVLIGSNMKAEIFESGAQICDATITRGGVMYVSNGGAAVDADVTQGGKIFLCSGGSASGTVLKGTLNADAYSYLFDTVIENGGVAYILNMAQADMITVKQNGNLYVGMAGEASGITLENGALHVATGGRVYDVRVDSGSQLFLYGGAILDGVINVNGTVTLDDLAVNNGRVNFVLAQKQNSAPMVNDLAFLSGGDLSVSVDNASEGLYLLAQNAAEFDGEFAVMSDESSVGSLGVGDNIFVGNKEFLLLENSGNLHIQCYNASDVYALSRNEKAISWRGLPTDTPKYIVEYSRTNGAGKLQFNTATKGVDTFSFDSGSFQWRVSADGKLWAEGDSFNVEQSNSAQVFLSQANGNMDLFFATPDGVWEAGYAACHVGYGQWEGTGEAVSLDGKNRITHIFEGSSDANLLVLTDDVQGDVLFTDDIFSALPGSVAEQQSRLSQINEIRAGSGDDIIDLTSQRFAWSGDGLTVCGGDGDDVIWANASANILLGDAGNDRITGGNDNDIIAGGSGNDQLHGGGGEDTFTFGSNWGNDQITQLENGSVTLWLAEGSMEHWNAETLTYSDGENTITVSGCADINFKFGVNPEDDERFFAESTTCRIFE